MSGDITQILRDWEYDPEDQIRIIQGDDDARQVLQVRQPLGIEQYELDGRPDGKQPFGKESFLDEIYQRLDNYRASHGTEDGFIMTQDDFELLQSENMLYYSRYLVLFQIGDFVRTVRDTEHNLKACDLVEHFLENTEKKKELLQYRPYILRMNAIARAMISLHNEMKSTAREIIESAISDIENMEDIDTPAFQFERVRSLNYLKETLKQVLNRKSSHLEKLKIELEQALQEEDYEKAAVLRDKIKELDQETEP